MEEETERLEATFIDLMSTGTTDRLYLNQLWICSLYYIFTLISWEHIKPAQRIHS